MKNSYLGQAWLVLALGAILGGALAGVQIGLREKIETNKTADLKARIPVVVPGAKDSVEAIVAGQKVYKGLGADGKIVGWAVHARGQGFADVLEVLIGLDAAAERITGLAVLDQKETPGLGNKIEDPPFTGQFPGKSAAGPLVVVKRQASGNEITAVTGATISSESIAGIVNQAVASMRAELAKAAKE